MMTFASPQFVSQISNFQRPNILDSLQDQPEPADANKIRSIGLDFKPGNLRTVVLYD